MKVLMKMKAIVDRAALAMIIAMNSLMVNPAVTALASEKKTEEDNVFMEVADPIVK